MKIQNQSNYNISCSAQNKTTFQGNFRHVTDLKGNTLYRNTSFFFRDDINWEKFTDFIIEKYKDAKKVNVHCFACSEGAEPFSLAMMLSEKLGAEKAKKFFPIIASDVDEEILKNPKQGIIKPSSYDIEMTKFYMGPDYKKYITHGNQFKQDEKLLDRVADGNITDLLKPLVEFKNLDLIKDNLKMPKANTIVLCRNVWPYLSKFDINTLAKKLSNGLGENSMLMLGGFDSSAKEVYYLLRANGFTEGPLEYLYLPNPKQLTDPEFLMNTFASKNK